MNGMGPASRPAGSPEKGQVSWASDPWAQRVILAGKRMLTSRVNGDGHTSSEEILAETVHCKMATESRSPDFFPSQVLFQTFARAVARDNVHVKNVVMKTLPRQCPKKGTRTLRLREPSKLHERHCPRTAREILPLARSLYPRAHST